MEKADAISNSVDHYLHLGLVAGATAFSFISFILMIGMLSEARKRSKISSGDPGYRNPYGFSMPKPKIYGTLFLMIISIGGACVAVWLLLSYTELSI